MASRTIAKQDAKALADAGGVLGVWTKGTNSTLLADGRVLIAGGQGSDFKTQSSAELYDPRTGTFMATGNMITPRGRHSATLLPDGRVLIAGGVRANANPGASAYPTDAELYDPGTGTFSAAGEMSTPRGQPTATLLNNGKVLFAAWCYTSSGFRCFPDDAELYDPGTGTLPPLATGTGLGLIRRPCSRTARC